MAIIQIVSGYTSGIINGNVKFYQDNVDNKIYLFGSFTTFSGHTGLSNICRLNDDGSFDSTFTGHTFNGAITCMTRDAVNDKLYLGGAFTTYSGISAQHAVSLNLDGSYNSTFDTTIGFSSTGGSGTAGAIILTSVACDSSGTTYWVNNDGGIYYKGVIFYNGMISILPNGNRNTDFAISPAGGDDAYIVFIKNDEIFIGGDFKSIHGGTYIYIDKLLLTGYRDTSFNSPFNGLTLHGGVRDIYVDDDGYVYITGRGPQNSMSKGLWKLNSDGSFYSGFTSYDFILSGCTGNVTYGWCTVGHSLIVYKDKIIVVGGFNSYNNNVVANNIIVVNQNGDIDNIIDFGTGFNLNKLGTYSNNLQDVILTSTGDLLVAGSMSSYNSTGVTYLTKLNTRYYFGNYIPTFPPSFCDGTNYIVSASTCGNSNGKITISDTPAGYYSYFDIYDFTLTDVTGGTYTFNTTTGEATGLTSGYYFLTATVKPEYWSYYGRESCTFEWLKVEDSDTTMANTGVSVRNTICGGFGKQQGRIAYICTDSGANPVYTAKLYNKETHDLVQTVTGNTIDLIIFVPLSAADYYCHITNSAGCSLLIGSTRVSGESLRSVAGIKRLWLTKWDANIEYDYWAQSDEDYYLASVDADFFNSIKIKRFVDSTLPDIWYSVNVQTKGITFQQSLEKSKQGFVFTSKLTLTIPHADNTKWKELQDLLQDRYIIVFQDNNSEYWCMGYKYGSSVDGYKRENNEYILEFNDVTDNKLLTSLDSTYVKSSIL